ncbi:MAG: carboxypeptidase regulatory-like domain-containing protein [Planctomycetes bacterium]|nr:carboxypeptidase regulatory-like domain-containing protein [Planctomycetota bacterium]
MKPFAALLAALTLLAALAWVLLDGAGAGPSELAPSSRELAPPAPLATPATEALTTQRERERAPSPEPERRAESARSGLCTVRGAIAGGELRDAVLAFRAPDGTLHLAALDPSDASYRLELAPGEYRACFASPWAAPYEELLRLREGEREQVLDLEPSFLPVLPIEVLTTAGAPLLGALGPSRYGWRASEGLGGLGLALDCGGTKTPLALRAECVVRVPLPTTAKLFWGELGLGEQPVARAGQKLAFAVDPALFDRGEAARLVLRVVDARTQKGLARAELLLQHDFGIRRISAKDAQGSFAANELPAGALALRVEAPGYVAATRTLQLQPGVELELDAIALEPAAAAEAAPARPRVRCELHVLAYPTQPVLLLEGASGSQILASWTLPAIEARELAAGSYRVRCGELERALELAPANGVQQLRLP